MFYDAGISGNEEKAWLWRNAAPDEGCADIFVDSKLVKTVNPREIGWTHCNAVIVFNEKAAKPHVIEIRMMKGMEDKKFTILGFGDVE